MNGYFLAKGDGLGVEILGARYVFKIRSRDSHGRLCQFIGIIPPGQGSPPHRVHREDKTFLVLEGQFEFLLDQKRIAAKKGGFVSVPRGTIHHFVNSGSNEARLLVTFTPAGCHEEMFSEIAALPSGPVDVEALLKISAKYGVEVL